MLLVFYQTVRFKGQSPEKCWVEKKVVLKRKLD